MDWHFAVLFIRKNCKRMSSSSHKRNESTEDDADNVDIVVCNDGPSHHEQKRWRLANVKRKTFLLNVKHFTDKILREPDIWMQEDLGFLRKFIDSIKNDPVHFPPSMASHQYAPEAHILDWWAHCLSKNFVQGVYSRSIFSLLCLLMKWILLCRTLDCVYLLLEAWGICITTGSCPSFDPNQNKQIQSAVRAGTCHKQVLLGCIYRPRVATVS